MLQLIKGVGVKTIATITATIIAVLLGVVYYLYTSNTAAQKEVGAITQENGIYKQNDDFSKQSAAITDKVVSDLVLDRTESKQKTETLRRETKDEYVKKIDVPQSTEEPDGADRVRVLARGMHENYCRARGEDPRCTANTTNP